MGFALLTCLLAPPAHAATTILDIRGTLALLAAPAHPRATIVMLPGGSGIVGIRPDGTRRLGDNFTVRTTALWNARGDAVLIPDALGGRNERGERSTVTFAEWVARLVATAREKVPGVPVFLLGTSQGSIAAMNGAAHAGIAGVVLTESVSVRGRSGETVFDADPQNVRAPALVVANTEDRCDVAPPDAARRIAAAMTASADVRVLTVSGGEAASPDPCSSRSPHGYWGMDAAVVAAIGQWLDVRR